jgi:hypothetical protein
MIEQTNHQAIASFAEKRLSPIHARMFPFEIRGRLQEFRNDLINHGFIEDDQDDEEALTHSEKIPLESEAFFQFKNIALWSAMTFDVAHYCVLNNQSGDGIIFVGYPNHIEAARQVFHVLKNISVEMRNAIMNKLKHFKKESTRNERADERVEEWLANVLEQGLCEDWPDNSDHVDYVRYIQKHFKTSEDQTKVMRRALDIFDPFYNKEIDASTTTKSFEKEVFSIFPLDYIGQTAEELKSFQNQDMIMLLTDRRQ